MFSPADMPINTPIINTHNDIEVTTTRTGVESAEVVFRSKATKEVVLSTQATADGPSVDVSTIDTVFWDIRINGVPATRTQWSKVMQPGANVNLVADAAKRTINVTLQD